MDAVFGDLLKALLGLGAGGVVAAVMTFMWKRADDERKDLQDKFVKLLEETTASRLELANSLAIISAKVGAAHGLT